MTTQQKAEELAKHCLVELFVPENVLFRSKTSVMLEHIPLTELLAVAEAAWALEGSGSVRLDEAVAKLRAKLPKGIEL